MSVVLLMLVAQVSLCNVCRVVNARSAVGRSVCVMSVVLLMLVVRVSLCYVCHVVNARSAGQSLLCLSCR